MSDNLIKLIKVSVVIFLIGFVVIGFVSTSAVGATKNSNTIVCPAADVREDFADDTYKTFTYNAPAGKYIVYTCVKAGSPKSSDESKKEMTYAPEQKVTQVTLGPIVGNNGENKYLSHYAIGLATIPVEPTDPPTTTPPTTAPPTTAPPTTAPPTTAPPTTEPPTDPPTTSAPPTTEPPTETPTPEATESADDFDKAIAKANEDAPTDPPVVAETITTLPKTGPGDVTPWILILGASLAMLGTVLKVFSRNQ